VKHRYPQPLGTDREVALAALRAAAKPAAGGMAFVPEAVEHMLAAWRSDGRQGRYAPDWERKAAHNVLRKLDREGVIELRPESGLGLYSDAQLALCPVGLGGVPLSWARLL
jgi:hypothetical protein